MSSSNPTKPLGPAPASTGNSVFLYGALMYPDLLRRIMGYDGASHIELSPAILFSYTRFHIKDKNYPAIVPSQVATSVLNGREPSGEDQVVRGVLAKGLTAAEIERLDEFQSGAVNMAAGEFARKELSVLPHGPSSLLQATDPTHLLAKSGPIPQPSSSKMVPAYVYAWDASSDRLASETWDFDSFVEHKFWKAQGDKPDPLLYGWALGPEGGEGDLVKVQLR